MNLLSDVKLKNISRTFMEYSETVKQEQLSSVNYLKSPDFKWNIPDSLRNKVDLSGSLTSYSGDTVVIKLEEKDILIMSSLKDRLYNLCPEFLAEPLDKSQFHITLHDLNSGKDKLSLNPVMEENRIKCEEIFRELASYFKAHPEYVKVTLKPLFIYPCCNISLVTGFIPATDRDFRIIMNVYNLFDNVLYLDYWLRLHITLSYFKLGDLNKEEGEKLYNILNNMIEEDFLITLDLKNMAYQRFFSMNEYRDFLLLSSFL